MCHSFHYNQIPINFCDRAPGRLDYRSAFSTDMNNVLQTYNDISFLLSQRKHPSRHKVPSTAEIHYLCSRINITFSHSYWLSVSLVILPSLIDVLPGLLQIMCVIYILHDRDYDSKLFARKVRDLNLYFVLSCSIAQDTRKCKGMQLYLVAHSIHVNISVNLVYFAVQAYIFDTIENDFMRCIVHCNLVSLFCTLDQPRSRTVHNVMLMTFSTVLPPRQYYNLLHISVLLFGCSLCKYLQ